MTHTDGATDHYHRRRRQTTCPRCGLMGMRTYDELSGEEREVVRRLPASAEHTTRERHRRHQWCTRCWYEAAGDEPMRA